MDHSKLTRQIFWALVMGSIVGIFHHQFISDLPDWISDVFHVTGRLYVNALMMLVIPVVFVSLVCGVASLKDLRLLGRMGLKTLAFYLATTFVAITLALLVPTVFGIGQGFSLPIASDYVAPTPTSPVQVLLSIIPTNPLRALVEGQMLAVIFFSLLLGVAISISGAPGERVSKIFSDLNVVVMRFVELVMRVAPIGVFALVEQSFAKQGLETLKPMLGYFLAVITVLLIHALLVYPLILTVLARYSPLRFFREIREVLLLAFSSASSNATLPVTIEVAETRLKIKNELASFSLPLGATVNMDGTAIMQGVATVFIANASGIELGMTGYITVIVMATLASVGTAGVPSVGLVTLAMVLRQVKLPVEGIAVLIGIDRFLDMLRTAVNVCGDLVCTVAIAHQEKMFSEKR